VLPFNRATTNWTSRKWWSGWFSVHSTGCQKKGKGIKERGLVSNSRWVLRSSEGQNQLKVEGNALKVVQMLVNMRRQTRTLFFLARFARTSQNRTRKIYTGCPLSRFHTISGNSPQIDIYTLQWLNNLEIINYKLTNESLAAVLLKRWGIKRDKSYLPSCAMADNFKNVICHIRHILISQSSQ